MEDDDGGGDGDGGHGDGDGGHGGDGDEEDDGGMHFLAVQDSSIGDLVTHSLITQSVSHF